MKGCLYYPGNAQNRKLGNETKYVWAEYFYGFLDQIWTFTSHAFYKSAVYNTRKGI
jgi:hypothetical protein